MRRFSGTAARIGAGGLILPLASGVAVGYAAPMAFVPHSTSRSAFALLLGVVMAASAIPVIAKTLADLKLLHRNVGQLILCACALDDAVAWFMLSLVAAVATTGIRAGQVTLSAGLLVGFVFMAVAALRPLVRAVLSRTAKAGQGPSVCTTVVLVLMCATITQAMGMEAVFGAFVAGILIGQAGPAARTAIAPLRTVVMATLAPLFLATAGLRVDFTVLRHGYVLLWALALLAVAVISKFAGAYLGGRVSALNHWESTAVGAGMNARGVVEIVIAAVGLRLGVLDTTTYTIVVFIALTTSMMAPPLLRLAMARVETNAEEDLRLATIEG